MIDKTLAAAVALCSLMSGAAHAQSVEPFGIKPGSHYSEYEVLLEPSSYDWNAVLRPPVPNRLFPERVHVKLTKDGLVCGVAVTGDGAEAGAFDSFRILRAEVADRYTETGEIGIHYDEGPYPGIDQAAAVMNGQARYYFIAEENLPEPLTSLIGTLGASSRGYLRYYLTYKFGGFPEDCGARPEILQPTKPTNASGL